MEKPTTKSNENENYWGYILFSAIALICTLNSGYIYQFLAGDNDSNHNRTYQSTTIDKKETESKEKIYTCSICSKETGKHADQMWKGKCYMCYEATKKKRNH
ncbi:hypothetical protein A8C32_17740 [Flavivirga aquatica]|uniref:Uncharacterized protein n=1 Tax=Flavivirga aquatica TaxID=1849968 RepID=A0A1E5T7C4_9FLAO|nr:hypothetical protein [Flavivirga aquatica]OEK07281.1 hypothetical protein A8C32_17740 [Flavivirga aquatica]